jgi:hypothetical protein
MPKALLHWRHGSSGDNKDWIETLATRADGVFDASDWLLDHG